MKLSPKPPIVRDKVFGQDDAAHQNPQKLDDGGKRTGEWGPSLRNAVKVLRNFTK
jgi:hypothetical protein